MYGSLILQAKMTVTDAAASSPVLVNEVSTGNTSAGTSLSLTFGFTPTAGNTLLLAVREYVAGDATTPSGWTLVTEQLPSGSVRPCVWYSKISDGTETAVTVAFANSQGHGLAVQEWQGSVAFSGASGLYIASGITNPQVCGPSTSPPSASAVPSTFAWWNNVGTNQVTWPAGWTGTSSSLINAHNSCEIGSMATAPNAAVSPSLSFTQAPGSYMYWWTLWVDNA